MSWFTILHTELHTHKKIILKELVEGIEFV